MYKYKCPSCNQEFTTVGCQQNVRCPYCGATYPTAYGSDDQPPMPPQPEPDLFSNGPSGKSRGVAGLLAIFLGALGVHYFYLGKPVPGVVFLLISIFSFGLLAFACGVVGIVQGLIMLTGTQQSFESKYVNTSSQFPLF